MDRHVLRWLAAQIGDATRQVLIPVKATRLGSNRGISTFQVWVADADAQNTVAAGGFDEREATPYFVKFADADHTMPLVAEADGLAALERADAIRVPRIVVLADAPDEAGAALVLEWMSLVPIGQDPHAPRVLATQFVTLHGHHGERFGWHRDNFIGALPQHNDWGDDWCEFFRDWRLHPQLRLAAQNRLPSRMIDRGMRLLSDLGALFRGHAPKPALVHGDLWPGNVACVVQAGEVRPVIYDPAVYYADREVDLAMAAMFGGLPPDFFAVYTSLAPLPDGANVRKRVYDLYHMLNHANMFAGDYVRASEDLIERCLAEIR